MKVLVCGGRDYDDAGCVDRVLREVMPSVIVHGRSRGADWLADCWARQNRIPVRRYAANWLRYGPTAGPLRNQWMLDIERPDLVVAFPGGRGTADMIRRAKAAGIPVRQVA